MNHFSNSRYFSCSRTIYRYVINSAFRPIVHLDDAEVRKIQNGVKPGRKNLRLIKPPNRISQILQKILSSGEAKENIGHKIKNYLGTGQKMSRSLKSRSLPLEPIKEALIKERLLCSQKLLSGPSYGSEALERKVEKLLRSRDGNWKAIAFDHDASWSYLLVRSPFDYAASLSSLSDLVKKYPEFKPQSHLDFGAGVGSFSWAIAETFGDLKESFYVDPSPDMNDISKYFASGGNENGILPPGIFYRLHFPASESLKYDLVTESFTLVELSSQMARLQTVDSLWERVEENGFLILVEQGTNAGFQVLAEARDYLLQRNNLSGIDEKSKGYLVAPCPSELSCPRYHLDDIPCNFDVKYGNFSISHIPSPLRDASFVNKFSYLIFRKSNKDKDKVMKWPRMVQEKKLSRNRFICELCTQRGSLEEAFVHKRTRALYDYTKYINNGDEYKVHLTYNTNIQSEENSDSEKYVKVSRTDN